MGMFVRIALTADMERNRLFAVDPDKTSAIYRWQNGEAATADKQPPPPPGAANTPAPPGTRRRTATPPGPIRGETLPGEPGHEPPRTASSMLSESSCHSRHSTASRHSSVSMREAGGRHRGVSVETARRGSGGSDPPPLVLPRQGSSRILPLDGFGQTTPRGPPRGLHRQGSARMGRVSPSPDAPMPKEPLDTELGVEARPLPRPLHGRPHRWAAA